MRIPIVCGSGGFNGNDNQARIPVTDLISAENVCFEGDAWRKLPGASVDSAAVPAAPILIAGHDWNPAVGTQRLVTAWSSGAIYKGSISDVSNVALRSGLTIANPGVFVEGGQEAGGANRKLFFFCRGMVPQVLSGDGATTTDIATPSADWTLTNQPGAGLRFGGHLLAYYNPNYPHAVYGSALDDQEDFTTTASGAFVTDVWAGEGEYVAAVIPFLSTTGSTRLYVFKYPYGLYYLDLTDVTDPIAFKVRDDVGMAGPLAWCRVQNDVIFMSSQGSVHSLRAVESSEDIAATDLSAALSLRTWLKDNIYFPRLAWATAIYDEVRKEARFAFTATDDATGGTYTNGTGFIVDLKLANTPRLAIEKRGLIVNSLFRRKTAAAGDVEICGGGVGGLVYRFGQEARNVNTAAFTAKFRTIDTDLGFKNEELVGLEKRFDYLEATVTETGSYNLDVNVYVDGEFSETVSMNLGVSGSVYGAATFYGTAVYGGSQAVSKRKVKLNGHGNTIGLEGVQSGLNQDFSLSEMAVWCKTSGTRGAKVGA